MHGYEANLELERREIRDWAAVSRPQVYYSLEKLARLGFLREVSSAESSEGPERRVLGTTAAGRAALAHSLERSDWATQRERPAFLIWLALSWRAESRVVKQQIARRREYVERELAKERETLQGVLAEVGHRYHEAVWMITLVIEQFETELRWLKKLEREIRRRGNALHTPDAPQPQR